MSTSTTVFTETRNDAVLSPYRVLDLTDDKGYLCGRILADLGADVLKIEPPGGDPARRHGPFYHDENDPNKSLFWYAYNSGKRGITLDLNAGEGHALFERLVRGADFIIESFPPGHMNHLGLDYERLAKINPRLIYTAITPFGQTGPYRDYKAGDLVAMAMGGLMYLNGDPDRAPLRVSSTQCFLLAGTHAVAATMVAHHHRRFSGEGQYVDVSAQESVLRTMGTELGFWEFAKEIIRREGARRRRTPLHTSPIIWPCKDGHIIFFLMWGRYGKRLRHLAEWMEQEGFAGSLTGITDWGNLDLLALSPAEFEALQDAFAGFFAKHSKAELWEAALRWRLLLCPVNTISDIVADPQLAARGYWQRLAHPELGESLTYPGTPFQFSEMPCTRSRRAPLIGEHNVDIYVSELGLSTGAFTDLQERGLV